MQCRPVENWGEEARLAVMLDTDPDEYPLAEGRGQGSGRRRPPMDEVDDVPTVSCSRCGREWDLAFELDELRAGNQALEQFALDHERHTGHFPDEVTPWVVDCRRCPDREGYLAERPARRWAATHARHTGHAVAVTAPEGDRPTEVIEDSG